MDTPADPGEPADCPARFTLCFDLPTWQRLAAQLRQHRDWMREAWARCGPLETTPPSK